MTVMEDRERAFENKFAHDKEMQFKATARRNKLLGYWVADKLGKDDEAKEAYALEVIEADFEEAGDDDVLRKVHADLTAAGVEISKDDVRREMDYLLGVAKQQIMEEV